MSRFFRWWNDHRTVARWKDGRWVPAPMRIERAWMWLMHRGKPIRCPRRITFAIWWAFIISQYTFGARFWRWLYVHPQLNREVGDGFEALIWLLALAGLVVFVAGWDYNRKRRKRNGAPRR